MKQMDHIQMEADRHHFLIRFFASNTHNNRYDSRFSRLIALMDISVKKKMKQT